MASRLLWVPALLTLLGPCSRNDTPAPPPPVPIPAPPQVIGGTTPGAGGVPTMPPPPTMPTTPMPVPGQPIAPPGTPVAMPPGAGVPGAVAPSAAAPGTVRVTVTATSTPPGATVSTMQGRVLGTTPLVTYEVIPAPAPGQPPPTFTFVLSLPGYPAQNVSAAPLNNILALAATFPAAPPPSMPGMPTTPGMPGMPTTPGMPGMPTTPGMPGVPATPGMPGMPTMSGASGSSYTIVGTGGGAIFDNHTTTAQAFVSQSCIVGSLRVTLRGNHTFNSDMTVRLSSPSGQTFTLQRRNRRSPFRTYTVPRAQGLPAAGSWNLAIADTVRLDAGRLTSFTMELTCQ